MDKSYALEGIVETLTPIKLVNGCGMYEGRQVRLLECGLLQFGDDNFDRWANSVEFEFDLVTSTGQRALKRFISMERPYG